MQPTFSSLNPRLVTVALLFASFVSALPCTTFVLQSTNHVYFGRNLDWDSEDALVIVNPRKIQKTALVMPGTASAKWVSKYGSVTFNSAGWDLPTGGMNEKGLVVEDLWLVQTHSAKADDRPALSSLQWIQYQLDNCQSIDEVIDTDTKVRVDSETLPIPVHYLICDKSGDCAVIEFLDGKMKVHRGDKLPCKALANAPYDISLKIREKSPKDRFAQAAARVASFKPASERENLDYAFTTLDHVAQGAYTKWRMVYDITGRTIHYRTLSHPDEQALDLRQLDFSCRSDVRFFDLSSRPQGKNQPAFSDLTELKHRKYLERYLSQKWVKDQFGDLRLFVEGMLLNLRSYHCADAPVRAAR
jgi:penicillin V acylase-like amidase (Ntn superfamily)